MIDQILKEIQFPLNVLQAYCLSRGPQKEGANDTLGISFVCEEFFHKDLRGFGGFGKTVKNISDHYNLNGSPFQFNVLLSQSLSLSDTPAIRRFHNADVLLRPRGEQFKSDNFLAYARLIRSLETKIFLTIDYYPTYERYLLASPTTPVVIWIRDPRSRNEWGKLAQVPLELKQRGKSDKENLLALAGEKELSLKRVLQWSKFFKRKVIFVSNGQFLVERAQKTYGLPSLKPHMLLNPIPISPLNGIRFSPRPSLCFLGRLDAQKRFWIVLELAKRFPGVDFYMAGDTHAPELMNPIIEKYRELKNVRFLGLVDGADKDRLLENCWGLINTSVHEGLPVSFLETFAFGKCVISCQNPEGLVEKFGFYTGEIEGEGLEKSALDRFSSKIEEFLASGEMRVKKGRLAREYIENNHTFQVFENRLLAILSQEKVV